MFTAITMLVWAILWKILNIYPPQDLSDVVLIAVGIMSTLWAMSEDISIITFLNKKYGKEEKNWQKTSIQE